MHTSPPLSINEFAEKLTAQLIKRYPPELDNQPAKRPSVNRLARILEDACDKVVEYQAQMKLGWFGKARLSNKFRWNLLEAGYSKDFVKFATEAIVVHISRKSVET